jgi:pantoate--beta-alanine ligase
VSSDTLQLLIPIARFANQMQDYVRARRAEGKTIGCVPTMGALHEGHLSLIRKSASECDETIVTIFVNPLQFGPSEDLAKYPRNETDDIRMARDSGATVAYCPSVETMYSHDRSVYVVEESLSNIMCGKCRPGHFRGVTTVVAKLFNACLPDRAYFGSKDYQQLLVIKRMVRDLDFPVEIVPCPIVRESDGLAMSSRNRCLSPSERIDALCLKKALDLAVEALQFGERDPRAIVRDARETIEKVAAARVDYIECRDADTLDEIEIIDRPAVLAFATYIGSTRLIDNTVLTPPKKG